MDAPLHLDAAHAAVLTLIRRPMAPLEALAAQAGLSPAHFQRQFRALTGISPKQLGRALSRQRLLAALRDPAPTPVLDAAIRAGLSGPGRAHELILSTDGATPAEWARGGEGLVIRYGTVETDLGDAFAAWTGRGLAALRLGEDARDGVRLLQRDWPAATLIEDAEAVRPAALAAIQGQGKAHVRGSAFQLRVWLALMSLPPGALLSYGQVAAALGLPNGSRAVGRALGENPVAVLIPCHRVIQATGAFSGYRWGLARKAILVGREMAE